MVASLPLSAGASPGCLRTFWSHPQCLLRCMADIRGVTCRISIDEAFPFAPHQWMWARLLQNRKEWDGDGIPVSAVLERWHHGLTRMYLGLAAFARISKKKSHVRVFPTYFPSMLWRCRSSDYHVPSTKVAQGGQGARGLWASPLRSSPP